MGRPRTGGTGHGGLDTMPLVIPRTGKRVRRIATLVAVACLGNSAVAAAACPTLPTTKSFAPFGDFADYSPAPGGSFEDATTAWSGGTLTADNERFFVNADSDTQSLSIPPKGVVTSPPFCIDAGNPYLRLFAKKPGDGGLRVEVLYTDANGVEQSANAGSIVQLSLLGNLPYAGWAPSPILKLGNA